MATDYKVAIGHNNAAGLALITPQPRSTRLRAARVVTAINGLAYEDGALQTEFVYRVLSWTNFNALNTAFGLTSAKSALVTLRLRKNDNTYANYNATIIAPTFNENANAEGGVILDVEYRIIEAEPI